MTEFKKDVYDFTGGDGTVSIANRRYVRTDVYRFEAVGEDRLQVGRNGEEKTVRIVKDSEYVWKLQKRQIRAADGAPGLYDFLSRNVKENFAIDAWVIKLLDWAMDQMTAA